MATSVTYDGPHEATYLPALDLRVKRGETIEVEDAAMAKSLIEQGWIGRTPPAKAVKKAEKERAAETADTTTEENA